MRIVLIAAIVGLATAPPCAGEELGRLFFTPEQRAALDARRKARIPDKPPAVVAESPTTRVDGYVKRQGGRSTVWLNGVPNPEGQQPEGIGLGPGRRDPLGVTLSLGEGESRFELRVGQRLDRGSGAVSDVVNEGAVRVRPGAKPVAK